MDNPFFYKKLEQIPNANTKKAYTSQLDGLLRKINEDANEKKQKNLILHILTHPKKYKPLIEKHYPQMTTRKNMYSLVLTIYKHADLKCEYKAHYEAWKKIRDECAEVVLDKIKTNEPSEKQIKKYLSFEEMEEGIKRLSKDNPHSTLTKSKEFCLLSMYSKVIPRRNDFGEIKIYNKDPDNKKDNYIVLDPKGRSFFVFNKRTKTLMKKQLVEPIDDDLRDVFMESIKRHPREYLYVGSKGPYNSNTFGKFVTKTFNNVFNKNTGSSMIRHIFDTEKIDRQKMTEATLEHFRDHMGHSSEMQGQYRLLFKKGGYATEEGGS